MQPCQQTAEESPPKALNKPLFSPSLTRQLKLQGDSSFIHGSAHYSQRHNIIIVHPLDGKIQLYDATTLLPLKGRQLNDVEQSVISLKYHHKTDVFLLGCMSGSIYLYNPSSDELKMLQKYEKYMLSSAFLSSTFYAFSVLGSKELYIGNLDNGDTLKFDSRNNEVFALHHLAKSQLLLSGAIDGSVRIYRTTKLPDLKEVCAIQAHEAGKWVSDIQSININGKEYVITTSTDCTMRIWEMSKERIRLVKVIRMENVLCSWVYLEDYKMIAVLYGQYNYIEFLRFPSGKLERRFRLKIGEVWNVFWMKDKNMIGVTDFAERMIDFVKLQD